jgi:hypothetical protein
MHRVASTSYRLNEVYFLTLVEAEKRLLVLTNPDFYAIFTRTTAGQIAPGVTVELLPLPPKMQRMVNGVTELASREMSREAVAAVTAFEVEEAGERGEDVRA